MHECLNAKMFKHALDSEHSILSFYHSLIILTVNHSKIML